MALFLGKAVSSGRGAGFAALVGAFSGLVVHTGAAAFGLSALLLQSAAAFGVLKAMGAAYLFWLAADVLRNGAALALDGPRGADETACAVYLKGLGVNLLNPKIVLFFVTFLPQFVSSDDPHAVAKLAFLGLYFIALALPLCVAMIMAAGRIAMWLKRLPRATRITDWLFAGVFAAFAVRLILERALG